MLWLGVYCVWFDWIGRFFGYRKSRFILAEGGFARGEVGGVLEAGLDGKEM